MGKKPSTASSYLENPREVLNLLEKFVAINKKKPELTLVPFIEKNKSSTIIAERSDLLMKNNAEDLEAEDQFEIKFSPAKQSNSNTLTPRVPDELEGRPSTGSTGLTNPKNNN